MTFEVLAWYIGMLVLVTGIAYLLTPKEPRRQDRK